MTNRRAIIALACLLPIAALGGCVNPNFIGVQDYGSIAGRVVDSGNTPINGAFVSSTGTTAAIRTGADGTFTLPQVAVGTQTVSFSAAGYGAQTASILVEKDKTAALPLVTLPSTTSIPTH